MIKVRILPTAEECLSCLEFPLNKTVPDCNNCWRINKNITYQLINIVKGFWGDYAIVKIDNKEYKIPLYRIQPIEENKDNEN